MIIPAAGAGQALSPELEALVSAVPASGFSKYIQHPFTPAFRRVITDRMDQLATGIFFKIADYITQRPCFGR